MKTIFKPETTFSLKQDINLKFTQKQCQEIYNKQKEKHNKEVVFALIDGPPYANGNIHIGHIVNKIQKDIFNQINYMNGKKILYITGSDCHGLPIEKKIELELKEEYKDPKFDIKKVDPVLIRERCAAFAKHWITIQNQEFSNLGVFGDWENHFATMDHGISIVDKFHQFVKAGYIYRGVRPIMWSIAEQTSMATAEVEYKQHESTAVDVAFPIFKSDILPTDAYCVIWTTTPWTLPANRAIAYNPTLEYSLIELDGKKLLLATNLVEAFLKRYNKIESTHKTEDTQTEFKTLHTFRGNQLVETICKHPLHDQGYTFPVPLLQGDHVTDTDGTGLVHTAPAHGEEDFQLGVKYGLEITDIVGPDGTFQNTPLFTGLSFKQASKAILESLSSNILSEHVFAHSYPYSWRSHTPLIYRVTPQWYLKLKDLKPTVLNYSSEIDWLPKQSQTRFNSMFTDRGDWCLSRQRAWGVPVALFTVDNQPIFDEAVLNQTFEYLKKAGVNAWWTDSAQQILGPLASQYPNAEKVFDILDVWFDAGSMQYCLQQSDNPAHNEVVFPASMYLEGSDQHRGFFPACLIVNALNKTTSSDISSSTIVSPNIVSSNMIPPAKTILTHGFILDAKGRKMSKSLGNVVSPSDILVYGIDVIRLWVALTDTTDDIKYSKSQMEKTVLIYNRFRNTIRYLLSCLHEFDQSTAIPFEQWRIYEKCVYSKLSDYVKELQNNPEQHRHTYQQMYNFCDQDLSSFLVDINKDIVYCDDEKSHERLSVLSCYLALFNVLILALTPVLKITAQEAWEAAGYSDFVYLETLPTNLPAFDHTIWTEFKYIRNQANLSIEPLRAEKIITKTLQACLNIKINPEYFNFLSTVGNTEEIITFITMTAKVNLHIDKNVEKIQIEAEDFNGMRCLRCRKYFDTLNEQELCDRCSK